MIYRKLYKSELSLRNTYTSKEWAIRRQIVRFRMSRLSGIKHESAKPLPSTSQRQDDQNYDIPTKRFMPKKIRVVDDNKWFDPENFPSSWKVSLFEQSEDRDKSGSTEFTWDFWDESKGVKDGCHEKNEKSPSSSRACDTTWSLSDEEHWDSFDAFPQSDLESSYGHISPLDHITEETFEQIWHRSDDEMSNFNGTAEEKEPERHEEVIYRSTEEDIFVQEENCEGGGEDFFSQKGETEGTISLLSKMRNGKLGRFVKIFSNAKKSKRTTTLFKRKKNNKREKYFSTADDLFEDEEDPKLVDSLTQYAPLYDDDVPFDEI